LDFGVADPGHYSDSIWRGTVIDFFVEWFPILLILAATMIILISQQWRESIIALFVQYLAVFWITAQVWPLGLAAVKLVTGWMAVTIISTSQGRNAIVEKSDESIQGQRFRLISAVIVWVIVFVLAPSLSAWFPAKQNVLIGGMLLIGIGLLQLGMNSRPGRISIGLLTVFSGFEIYYAAVEKSVLVTGLLAMITLGLAFTGAILINKDHPEEQE